MLLAAMFLLGVICGVCLLIVWALCRVSALDEEIERMVEREPFTWC